MNAASSSLRLKQIAAWAIVSIFVLGFFTPVGMWTGPVLGAWLVGTQRVGRGFVLMIGLALLFGMPHLLHGALHSDSSSLLAFLGWSLAAMVLSTLPFTFHRMVSPRLPGWFSTLPLPFFGVVFAAIAGECLPAGFATGPGDMQGMPIQQLGAVFGNSAPVFFIYWFAATVVWAWNQEFRLARIGVGSNIFAGVCVLMAGFCVASADERRGAAGDEFHVDLPWCGDAIERLGAVVWLKGPRLGVSA